MLNFPNRFWKGADLYTRAAFEGSGGAWRKARNDCALGPSRAKDERPPPSHPAKTGLSRQAAIYYFEMLLHV